MDAVVALVAEIRCVDGAEETVARLLSELSVQVRSEPGNLAFAAWRRVEDPGSFMVYEEYRDDAAFRQHLETSHSRSFNTALSALAVGGGSSLVRLAPLGWQGSNS